MLLVQINIISILLFRYKDITQQYTEMISKVTILTLVILTTLALHVEH